MVPYIQQQLIFEEDKIYFTGSNDQQYHVMMDWEDSLMKASADYICQNGGDILEIGFGMGISANYIQSHSINSHTIVENHPDILPILVQWAADKPNVIIVEGSWYDKIDELGIYDGIFYDTYGDKDLQHMSTTIPTLAKQGTLFTFWNTKPGPENIFGFTGVEYEHHEVQPPQNSYFNHTSYYLPKKQF
jgi:protein arginine N-methyltransferase 2